MQFDCACVVGLSRLGMAVSFCAGGPPPELWDAVASATRQQLLNALHGVGLGDQITAGDLGDGEAVAKLPGKVWDTVPFGFGTWGRRGKTRGFIPKFGSGGAPER